MAKEKAKKKSKKKVIKKTPKKVLPGERIECKYGKLVNIGDLKPNPQNPNLHTPDQIDKLAALITLHGWRLPIIVSERSGLIVAGHGRLMAAEKIGVAKVPVDFQNFKDDAEEMAVLISDNVVAELSSFDGLKMAELLNELDALPGVDLMAFTALDEEQILDFIHGPDGSGGEGLTDPDAVPENVKTRCKAGDLWQLGEHRLLCGDSTKKEDVERLMAGEKADITFTSPPYNAGKSESLSGNTHTKGNKYIGGHNDDMDGGSWLSLIQISLEMSRKVSSFQFYNLQQLAGNKIELIDLLYANRKYFADVAIWDKQNTAPAMAENVMNSQFEYVFIFSCEKSPNRAIRTGNFRGNVSNVYSGNPQRNNEFSDTHAATFPVDFPEHFISKFANIEKTVYEPFCGSGTTIIACEKTNRKCYGMEIDPHYCDVIIKRWEDFTGEKAKKLKPSRQNK